MDSFKRVLFIDENSFSSQKMSVQQLDMLKQQMSEYFQLTVQAFAIVKELKGPDDKDTAYWRNDLVRLLRQLMKSRKIKYPWLLGAKNTRAMSLCSMCPGSI